MSIDYIVTGVIGLILVGIVLGFFVLLFVGWLILTIKVTMIVLNAIITFTSLDVYEMIILGLWLLINVTLLS